MIIDVHVHLGHDFSFDEDFSTQQIIFDNEAAEVFSICKNVYGDTSWTPGFIIKTWIRKFGQRFMLGSDHADNTGAGLAKIRTAGFTEEEQETILSGTALQVFKLK